MFAEMCVESQECIFMKIPLTPAEIQPKAYSDVKLLIINYNVRGEAL